MASIDNSLGKSTYGVLFRYKLPTLQLNAIYYSNSDTELEKSSFTFPSRTGKIDCKIGANRSSYANFFNFFILPNQHLSNIHCLSYAILTDETGECVRKFEVNYHSVGNVGNFYILSSITIESLQKFLCDVGEPFLVLYVIDNSITDMDWSDLSLKMESYDEEMSISKPSNCCKYSESFSKLFIDKFLTDVVIMADNKEFSVHKCILSARSIYFSALFKHDVLENRESRILMKNKDGQLIKSDVAENFIKYLYTGVVEKLRQYGIQLYELAHMYGMEALQQECISYFKSNMDRENAIVLLILSKKFEIQDLQDCLFQFFQNNARDIFDSRNFKALLK